MNTFFATAGRTTANVIDGAIDLTKGAYTSTGRAGTSFAAGWNSQRRHNAMKRRYGAILEVKPARA